MSLDNMHVREWAQPLCNMTIGASITAFILVPPINYVTPVAEPQIAPKRIEIITTLPDGNMNPRTLYYCTSQGLNSGLISIKLDEDAEFENNNLPQMLRKISGLSVGTLAELVGVSSVAYNKWLVSGGIKSENIAQLTKLLDTFRTLRNLQVQNLKVFLESVGPSGKPLDLLIAGDVNAVIGLALRSLPQPKSSSTLSNEARQASGLAGWVRPAKRLNWNTPRLTGEEREDALDRLSPRPMADEMIIIDNSDEDD